MNEESVAPGHIHPHTKRKVFYSTLALDFVVGNVVSSLEAT